MYISVLGAGLVGAPMAEDLAADPKFNVTVVDRDVAALSRVAARADVAVREADLSRASDIRRAISGADLVVEATPGHMGYATLKTVIEAGVDVVSISFFPEDPFELDALARERGVVAVVDCGVFPGMGSALCMDAVRSLDAARAVEVLVGGLPEHPTPPLNYRSVFSPSDVIEEYVRPARYLRGGKEVVRPALSDVERVDWPGLGELESFNTDGIRTLARTLGVPDLREKTLRWPGTAAQMQLLRDVGLFDETPCRAGGVDVRPVDVTLPLLAAQWRMPEGEGDVTVLEIRVCGDRSGADQEIVWRLVDRWDPESGHHSMARTTGYTATSVVRAIAEGRYRETGITPPEFLGRDPGLTAFLLEELKKRGVMYERSGSA